MGLQKVAFNFMVERGGKLAKSLLCSKPQNAVTKTIGLKYAPELKIDMWQLSSDYSLCPKFLDKLRNIQVLGKDRLEQITQKIFNQMGYKSPIKIKLEDLADKSAGVSFHSGEIRVSKKLLDLSNEELIAMIRHELDHVDKYAKTIKNEGLENVINAFGFKHMSRDAKNFWQKLADESNTEGFDSAKYLQAIKDYKSPDHLEPKTFFQGLMGMHMYVTNPLEESAYRIQKQVAKYYNIENLTAYEVYSNRVKKIKDILLKHSANKDITIPKGFEGVNSFDELYCYARVLQEKNGVEILKDKNMGKVIEILQKECSCNTEASVLDQVYNWLVNEKFNLSDIIS